LDSDPLLGLELVFIFFLIVANGAFAMSEIAIVSSRKTRLERYAADGSSGAKAALDLANDPTQLLSAVQVGISAISVITGAFGGATIAKPLAGYLRLIPLISQYADVISMIAVVATLTYLLLIIGELVPKKIALNNPERIAIRIAIPMQVFTKIFSPLVNLLSLSTEWMLKFLGVNNVADPGVTEEEIKSMLAEGAAVGTVETTEKEMVDRVFRLGDLRVSALMTPRTQIDWLDLEESDAENWSVIVNSRHTRLPVARGSLDGIIGVVETRDLLLNWDGKKLNIEAYIQQPLFVPRSLRAFKLLEQFQQTGIHIAFVLDEFGGLLGIVTLHDFLEHLVGKLPEDEDTSPAIVQRSENSWLMDGLLSIEEFKELFGLEEMPGENKEHFDTLGGFITSYLDTMPQTGDAFTWNGIQFEIVDMDRMRIDKVMVTKLPPEGNII